MLLLTHSLYTFGICISRAQCKTVITTFLFICSYNSLAVFALSCRFVITNFAFTLLTSKPIRQNVFSMSGIIG